jgi:wyosine [tRNA(Phe)-imidazoG37] synthetase (radical SAM superfamily)
MKLCERALNAIQIINQNGEVRICGWQNDGGVIGSLLDHSLEEIYHSPAAELIRERHMKSDFSNCNANACPYVANNLVDECSIEVDQIPRIPSSLYLAYENVCNYRCVMCTIPDCMIKNNKEINDSESKLNKIDTEIFKVLPYIKEISANGLGELFASKHILNILSQWRPIADPVECSVVLETNGSMFNRDNWKKISNLGQYDLYVVITVLSFDEKTYHELSGTTLPIDNLLQNLHFVKQLRSEGIINKFEIATVYQEKNFRTLPEFTRRCFEEFCVDSIRLRPYEPWREVTLSEWYRDVRNEYHPSHHEFLEIMKDPIFKDPRVFDWGGGRPSGLGSEPYVKTRTKYQIIENIFCQELFGEKLNKFVNKKPIVIYGMAVVGKALVSAIYHDENVIYCIDRSMNDQNYLGISIYDTNHLEGKRKDVAVIISLERNEDAVMQLLEHEGYQHIIAIKDLLGDKIG